MQKVIVGALLCILGSSSFASEKQFDPFSFDLGVEGYGYNYVETDPRTGGFLMSDKGLMPGATFGIEYDPCKNGLKGRFETRYARSSSIRYKSNGSGTMDDANYWVSENRLLGLYNWNINDTLTVGGYSGVGHRYLNNDDEGQFTSTGHSAYLRTSQYFYLPIGVQISQKFDSGWSVSSYLEYDWFLKGTQKSHIGFTLVNPQRRGYGARAGLDLTIPDCNVDYVVGVFARHWKIADSKIVGGYLEPKNKTTEVGVKVGIKF